MRVCAVSALISIAGNDLNKSTPEVKAVIPVVIAALKDSDTEVRLAAIMAFQSTRNTYYSNDNFNVKLTPELKAAIPVLMETLKDENEQVRSNATSALVNIGSLSNGWKFKPIKRQRSRNAVTSLDETSN